MLIKNNRNEIEKALHYVESELGRLKLNKHDFVTAMVMAEESLVVLMEHTPENEEIEITFRKMFGSASLNLCAAGETIDLAEAGSFMGDVSGGFDRNMENAVRGMVLRARADIFRYKNKAHRNTIQIVVKRSDRMQLYLTLGAIVAVNALGDIYDWKKGEKVAGPLDETKEGFRSTTEEMYKNHEVIQNKFTANTTIGIVITNARFDKTVLTKIAGMTHNGYARAIRPVHTSADGDSIYAMSVGNVVADMDMVGTLAADVMAEAILNAVKHAKGAYGLKGMREVEN